MIPVHVSPEWGVIKMRIGGGEEEVVGGEKSEKRREKNRTPLPTVSTVVHTYLRQLVRCQDC